VWCQQDGVYLVKELSWASAGSGFTLLFEAFVMLLAEQMPNGLSRQRPAAGFLRLQERPCREGQKEYLSQGL
jgi:hypothetical protein